MKAASYDAAFFYSLTSLPLWGRWPSVSEVGRGFTSPASFGGTLPKGEGIFFFP